MTDLVVDTSFVLRWVFPDEQDDEADDLARRLGLGLDTVYAPPHMLIEAMGAVYRELNVRITPDEADYFLERLAVAPIRYISHPALYSGTLREAGRRGIRPGPHGPGKLYDVPYLVLAEMLGVPLWTGDKAFYDSLSPRPSWVVLKSSTRPRDP